MLTFISFVLAAVAIIVAIKASNRTFRLEKELSELKAALHDAKLSDASNTPISFPRASTSPSKAINPDAVVAESRETPSDESLRQAQYKHQQTIPSHYQAVKPSSPNVASVAHSAAKTPSSTLSDAANLSKERASTNTLNDLDTVFDRGLRKLAGLGGRHCHAHRRRILGSSYRKSHRILPSNACRYRLYAFRIHHRCGGVVSPKRTERRNPREKGIKFLVCACGNHRDGFNGYLLHCHLRLCCLPNARPHHLLSDPRHRSVFEPCFIITPRPFNGGTWACWRLFGTVVDWRY